MNNHEARAQILALAKAERERAADELVTGMQVKATQDGATMNVEVVAEVSVPAEEIFTICAQPHAHANIFDHVERLDCRLLSSVDETGPVVYEVRSTTRWSLWRLSGTTDAVLNMAVEAETRTVSFTLAEPGFLTKYTGAWRVEPIDESSAQLRMQYSMEPLHRPPGFISKMLKRQQEEQAKQMVRSVAGAAAGRLPGMRGSLPAELTAVAE